MYMLHSYSLGISPMNINVHQELRHLLNEGWMKAVDGEYRLEPKAVTLIGELNDFVGIHKKKSDNTLLGNDFEKNIEEYQLIFPKIKIPTSGKQARTNDRDVKKAFEWFFKEYKYDWDTILDAASAYVAHYTARNHMYMQTSQYFVRKDNSSVLADWCESMLNDNGGVNIIFDTKIIK